MLLRLSPDQVTRYWEDIRSALVSAVPPLANASQEGINTFLEGLLTGRLQAWALYEQGDEKINILALAITTVWRDIGTGNRNLLIYALYGYSFVQPESWKEGIAGLKEFAKREQCVQIVAFTRVGRVLDIVKELGGDTATRLITLEV